MENSRFIVQVENYEFHKDKIEKGPYIRHMDLAVSCSQLLHISQKELVTNRVTWDMLALWDMSPEELFRQAGEYSRKELAPVIEPMSDVIKGFLMEEFLENAKDNFDNALEKATKEYERLFGVPIEEIPEIYVLSNEYRIHGASVIFYDNVLQYFAKKKNCDLILLPSSIHEWLVLLEPSAGEIGELESMVRDANAHVVRPDEVLSNHVYRYSLRDGQLEIISEVMETRGGM